MTGNGSPSLREALFDSYRETQAATASGALYRDIHAAWPYYEANYGPFLRELAPIARILELGPGHGSLLAWLASKGYSALEGIDASSGDVDFANARLGRMVVQHGDAADYLADKDAVYSAVFLKAVLEHVEKESLLPLLHAIARSLAPDGFAVIDVPNMDWLLASHERYMDLTHEVGFTRESLASLLSLAFETVAVEGSRLAGETRSQRLFRPLLIRVLGRVLYVLGEGANDLLFSSRSLIAVARSPISAEGHHG